MTAVNNLSFTTRHNMSVTNVSFPTHERARQHRFDPSAILSGDDDDGERAAGSGSGTGSYRPYHRSEQPDYITLDWKGFFLMMEDRNAEILQSRFGGVEGMLAALKTDAVHGVDDASVEARLEQFGYNRLVLKAPVTFWEFLLDALSDRVVQILIVAAVISIVFGLTLPNPHTHVVEYASGWIEGVAICISVIVVVLSGSINNYQKAKKFEEMEREQSVKDVEVIRRCSAGTGRSGGSGRYRGGGSGSPGGGSPLGVDGVVQQDGRSMTIKSDQVVVGDLISIGYGMELIFDGIVVQSSDLKLNESALTGEPDWVSKKEGSIVVSGTSVEQGSGKVIIVAVGMDTQQGRSKLNSDGQVDDAGPGDTPLQEHLDHLANLIGYLGFACASILVIALSIKEVVTITTQGKEASAVYFLNFVLIAITLIVVAIPEGLPLAVTIVLAFSMKAMMADNCLVRVLAACETMGAATAICSDKTGTLTTNEMTMVQGLVCGEEFCFEHFGIRPRHDAVTRADPKGGVKELQSTSSVGLDLFLESIAINNEARQTARDDKVIWVGNKTDQALVRFLSVAGRDYLAVRRRYGSGGGAENMRQYPFNSTKKRMTTMVRDPDTKAVSAYIKGASEVISALCDLYMDANGEVQPVTEDLRANWNAIISDMANQGNRTIATCMRQDVKLDVFPEEEPDLDGLVFLGVCGIQDPMRAEVPEAVRKATSAGITVRMVTGDNIHTAISISTKCGIFTQGGHGGSSNIFSRDCACDVDGGGFDIAMEGPEFRRMAQEEPEVLKEMLPRLKVLARSSPTDKLILVKLLQEVGEVVGVTGDGTNDAPALKTADVGFAMDNGTDIAKAASSMVLLDNNFSSVCNAIRWGRAVNDNIKRFLQFQLAINLAGVLLTLIGSLASPTSKEPLNPVQLLWLNLIMNTLAALALATELPSDSCFLEPPVYKKNHIINRRMIVFILIHGCFQLGLILAVQFVGHRWFHCVDNRPSWSEVLNCDQRFALVPVINATTGVVTQAMTPLHKRCADLCEFNGGNYVDGGLCQQGAAHSTMIFNIFIWFQIFNVVNARKLNGEWNPLEGILTRSRSLIFIFALIAGLQACAVELTGQFMRTTPLTPAQWGYSIGFGALEVVLGGIVRLLQKYFVFNRVPQSVMEKQKKVDAMMWRFSGAVVSSHEPIANDRVKISPAVAPLAAHNTPRHDGLVE